MTDKPTITILIPAFNEAVRLPGVLHDLHTHGYTTIVVVDDGSTDLTATIAQQAHATVLTHPHTQGQGAALQTGLTYIKNSAPTDIVITFDADGQHHAHDIAHLIHPIIYQNVDIVLGSRFLRPNTIPLIHRFILNLALIFTRLTSGLPLTDTHNGLRALSRHTYTNLTMTHADMAHASEIIHTIHNQNLRYVEVPVTITYHKSTNILSTIKRCCIIWWRLTYDRAFAKSST